MDTDTSTSTPRTRILALLARTPDGMTPTEMATALDASVSSVKKLMWIMRRDGVLSATDGRYRIDTATSTSTSGKGNTDTSTSTSTSTMPPDLLAATLPSVLPTVLQAQAKLDELHSTAANINQWQDEAFATGDIASLVKLRAQADALPMRIMAAHAVLARLRVAELEAEKIARDTAMQDASTAAEEYAPVFAAAKSEQERRMWELREAQEAAGAMTQGMAGAGDEVTRLMTAVRSGKALAIAPQLGVVTPEEIAAGKARAAKKQAYERPEDIADRARTAAAEAMGAQARAKGEKLYPEMATGDGFIRRFRQDPPTPAPAIAIGDTTTLVDAATVASVSRAVRAVKAARAQGGDA